MNDKVYSDGLEDGRMGEQLDRLSKDVERMDKSMNLLSKIGIGVLVAVGVWVGTIQTRQLRNIEDVADVHQKLEVIEERQSKNDINAAEIRTKLSAIEATLQEIKLSIGKIR